jgi:hypothetical protein
MLGFGTERETQMRKALTPLVLLAIALTGAACDEGKIKTSPKTFHPGQQTAVMPEDAPPQEEAVSETASSVPGSDSGSAASGSCTATAGPARAAALVRRCIAVSPATHPPCNAANACSLIQGEIDRSCAQYGPDETKPAECAD